MPMYLQNTNILCIEYDEYVKSENGGGIVPKGTYDSQVARGTIIRHQRGGNGNKCLIEFDSLPAGYRELYVLKYGDPYKAILDQPLLRMIRTDYEARKYFAGYRLPDERILPEKYQLRYSRQADWLNMIMEVTGNKRTLKETLRITMPEFWQKVIRLHQQDKPVNPSLPTSYERLLKKVRLYQDEGYTSLVVDVSRFTQSNARKVDSSIEGLIMALYTMEDRPSYADVCRYYNEFMAGQRLVFDTQTGEQFLPENYLVDGKPYQMAAETVKHYLKKPGNKVIVDSLRLSFKAFNDRHRPHMIRKAPFYAFSKITMDDTSSPFKMHNGDRPATYKVFDVASGAMIGLVMHPDPSPDAALIRRLLAEMMASIVTNGWKMPYEIEVEHALNRSLRGKVKDGKQVEIDLLTVGAVFPFVHFCAPSNPQEKNAEGFIRQIKDAYQSHRKGFQSRPFDRRDGKAKNEDVKDTTYTFEEILAMELEDQERWNSLPHPNKEAYPNMTRWQVLEQNQNPNLHLPNLPLIMHYIGNRTPSTTLRRGRVMVQGRKFRLPDIRMIQHLGSDEFQAYWLPEANGEIDKVYLYQDGLFVTEALYEEKFQQARAEQTDDDLEILEQQRAYRNDFDSVWKEGQAALPRVATLKVEAETKVQTEGEKAKTIPLNPGVDEPENPSYEGGYVPETDSSEAPIYTSEDVKARARRAL